MYFILDLAKRNYRVFFLVLTLNVLIPPLIFVALISTFIINDLDRVYRSIVYALAFPVYWTIRVQHDNYARKREAARLGAVLAPEVQGKWPGNIDLVLR